MLDPEDVVGALVEARSALAREREWKRFVDAYSRLILHVARSVARDHDGAMDAYERVLEALRADDFGRLRTYVADGRSKFSTWLVVVARRVCLDQQRLRYGRVRDAQSDAAMSERRFRRRLQDLAGEDVELTDVPELAPSPDDLARGAELHDLLQGALATISADDRVLLKLRFEDDLPARDIALMLGFPTPFHVYRRLESIAGSLRRMLKSRGVESAVP